MLDRISSAELVGSDKLSVHFTFLSGKVDTWDFNYEKVIKLLRDSRKGGLGMLNRVPVEWDGDNWRVYSELIR